MWAQRDGRLGLRVTRSDSRLGRVQPRTRLHQRPLQQQQPDDLQHHGARADSQPAGVWGRLLSESDVLLRSLCQFTLSAACQAK